MNFLVFTLKNSYLKYCFLHYVFCHVSSLLAFIFCVTYGYLVSAVLRGSLSDASAAHPKSALVI